MQAAVFLETLAMSYQAARRHIAQHVNFHEPCQEKVKFMQCSDITNVYIHTVAVVA
jgi:hypothetical protein